MNDEFSNIFHQLRDCKTHLRAEELEAKIKSLISKRDKQQRKIGFNAGRSEVVANTYDFDIKPPKKISEKLEWKFDTFKDFESGIDFKTTEKNFWRNYNEKQDKN